MGHRLNSARRHNFKCTLGRNKWGAFDLVRDLLESSHAVVPNYTALLQDRIPRSGDQIRSKATDIEARQLSGITIRDIGNDFSSLFERQVDMLSSSPRPWFTRTQLEGRWDDEVWCEGATLWDEDRGVFMFTDCCLRTPPEANVLEKLLQTLWKGWAVKYAHNGLRDLLMYMGIEESALCSHRYGLDWSSPAQSIKDVTDIEHPVIWLSKMEGDNRCRDYCYPYRWDGLVGLLTRGPRLINELSAAQADMIPPHDKVVGGAVIDHRGCLFVWPDSPEMRALIPRAWPEWQVEFCPTVDGWTCHSVRTGRPSSEQEIDWSRLVHRVLEPLNHRWSNDLTRLYNLDGIEYAKDKWCDWITAGEYTQTFDPESIHNGEFFAYLLARIQLGLL